MWCCRNLVWIFVYLLLNFSMHWLIVELTFLSLMLPSPNAKRSLSVYHCFSKMYWHSSTASRESPDLLIWTKRQGVGQELVKSSLSKVMLPHEGSSDPNTMNVNKETFYTRLDKTRQDKTRKHYLRVQNRVSLLLILRNQRHTAPTAERKAVRGHVLITLS